MMLNCGTANFVAAEVWTPDVICQLGCLPGAPHAELRALQWDADRDSFVGAVCCSFADGRFHVAPIHMQPMAFARSRQEWTRLLDEAIARAAVTLYFAVVHDRGGYA